MVAAIETKRLQCKHCSRSTPMNETNARVNGWRIWRGETQGGKPAEDVVCPWCAGTNEQPPPNWRVGCNTCDWEYEDEDGDDEPLDETSARYLADHHECEPDTWVKPPREES